MQMYFVRLIAISIVGLITSCADVPLKKTQPKIEIGAGTEIKPIKSIKKVTKPPLEIIPEIIYDSPINVSGNVQLHPTEFKYLFKWQQDNHAKAYSAFQRSCQYWRKLSKQKRMPGIYRLGTVGDWVSLCKKNVIAGQEKQFFEQWFKPYAIQDKNSFDGLFTGYFIPQLRGSYTKTSIYNVPIYKKPYDLIKRSGRTGRMAWGKFVKYYSRAEIYDGALSNKGLELLWVDSDVDAFFMEVQGSGRVLMDDGHLQGVSYGSKNGHAYFAIGKALVDSGAISKADISMQTIRAWIKANPEKKQELLRKNRSYVFFRLTDVEPNTGAVGAMNVPLTGQRSLAIDRKKLPLGVPLWLDVAHPIKADTQIRQLMMAQDTGGAIKGAIRGDFYWGEGLEAGELAGEMKSKGRFFILIPRNLRP